MRSAALHKQVNNATAKLWEKQRAQEEQDIMRQTLAKLKEDMLQKAIDEENNEVLDKLMIAKTRPRAAVIVTKRNIEKAYGYLEHENLWESHL